MTNEPNAGAEVDALECIYQHRLLTTAQVHELVQPDVRPRQTQLLLARHAERGLLDHTARRGVRGRPMRVWFITKRGAQIVEQLPTRAERRRRVLTPEQAAGQLQHHTLAVNDVGIAFVRAARQHSDTCGPLAWRHEVAHSIGPQRRDVLIADALIHYTRHDDDGASFHYRFLELDRATLPIEIFAQKISRYGALHRYRPSRTSRPLWHCSYPVFPGLLLVFAGRERARLTRRLTATLDLWQDEDPEPSSQLTVTCCLLEDLLTHGPFAGIFRTPAQQLTAIDWLGRHRQ